MNGKEKLFDGLKPMTPGFFLSLMDHKGNAKFKWFPSHTEIYTPRIIL